MTKMLVFNTDADAETALAQLNARGAMGYDDPALMTATWDTIRHRETDGRPVFAAPLPPLTDDDSAMSFIKARADGTKVYVLEDMADDWFPPPLDPMAP